MRLKTLLSMTNPGFTVVTNRTNHSQSSCENTRMTNHTVTCFQHAFDLSTLSTDRKALHRVAEVTESPTLLLPEMLSSMVNLEMLNLCRLCSVTFDIYRTP